MWFARMRPEYKTANAKIENKQAKEFNYGKAG